MPSDSGKLRRELLPSSRKTGTFKEKELFGGLSLKALTDEGINIFISFTTPVLGRSEVLVGGRGILPTPVRIPIE